MNNKSVLIVIAKNNFNEIEFTTVRTQLVNAGYSVFIASDANGLCVSDHGMKIKPDVHFFNINPNNFAGLVIVGGHGILDYLSNIPLQRAIQKFNNDGKIVSAICAAPLLLASAGILENVPITGYPKIKEEVEKLGAIYIDEPIVVHKNIITGKEYSFAQEFALALITELKRII